MSWLPHQLRHNAATFLRKEFGLETARIILGHRSAVITEVYAEQDQQKALEVIMRVEAVMGRAVERFGRLDGVTNCVGSLLLKPAHLTTPAEWQEVLQTNLTSAFNTVRYSEKLLERSGISVETLDLTELFGRAARIGEGDAALVAKIAAITAYVSTRDVPADAVVKMAKLGVVIDRWMADQRLAATALQCWTAMEEFYGVVPCTLMSMMSNGLAPSACETDVAGPVGMYALRLASGPPAPLVRLQQQLRRRPGQGRRVPLLEPAEGHLRQHNPNRYQVSSLCRVQASMASCNRLAFSNSYKILNDLTFTKKRSKLLVITLKYCLSLQYGCWGKAIGVNGQPGFRTAIE